MRSQRGPLHRLLLPPSHLQRATRIDGQPLRILLSRRLHLPSSLSHPHLPMWPPTCVFGHHRAACPEAGKRGFPLERSSASLPKGQALEWLRTFSCATSQFLMHSMAASRRLTVLALLRGFQLATDTTVGVSSQEGRC